MGYTGEALEFLKSHNVRVGDTLRIVADLTYEGILMPRYKGGQDIVLKLKNGYNIGIGIGGITGMERTSQYKRPEAQAGGAPPGGGLPRILLLSTGGTIASKIDYRTGAVTPAATPEELNASVPELAAIADIIPLTLFSEYSENLQPEHWRKIAEKLDSVAGSEYAGVIIAHGTDTMQYTASYLSFALAGFPIPVAVVGSQRSPDRPSTDAALNLIAAARFLTDVKKNGIHIVMHHDESDQTMACHRATRVRKNHTSRRGAFETVGAAPAFLVTGEKIRDNTDSDFFTKEQYMPAINLDARVALVKYHPGYDSRILDHIIDSGFRAVIFEGTGLGHVGRSMYESVKKAHKNGVFMGMTSQCIDGRVAMTVYESGRDLLDMGIVPLKDMIPETALVKAMWALGCSQDGGSLEELMLTRVASEFSD